MNEFIAIFQKVTENNAPMKVIKIRENKNKAPWFTDELERKIILKNKILRDWHLYGSKEDHKALKKLKTKSTTSKIN